MHLIFVFLVNTGLRTQLVDLWPCISQCNRQLLMGVNGYISQLFGSESNATLHSQAGMTPRAAGITWRDPPTSPHPTLNFGTESISHTGHCQEQHHEAESLTLSIQHHSLLNG